MTGRGGGDRGLIDQVFGTVLPQESTDERDHEPDDREQWLRENVPPHHI